MPPRRDQGKQGGDSPGVLAQIMDKFSALKADNEETKASNEENKARMTVIKSRSTPQSVHQASVEPPDALITQQAIVTPVSED